MYRRINIILYSIFLISIYIFLLEFKTPLQKEGDVFYVKKIDFSQAIYAEKINNRYFYKNYDGECVYISDIPILGKIIVNFTEEEIIEKEMIVFLSEFPKIREINFQKNEIICYNMISIKFSSYEDLIKLVKNYNDFKNIAPGDYSLINGYLFN